MYLRKKKFYENNNKSRRNASSLPKIAARNKRILKKVPLKS